MKESAKDPDDLYQGRWVAMVRGKVISQGGTPGQAMRAAQKSRYKERLEIKFMPFLETLNFPPFFFSLQSLLENEKDIFLVGGAVRDLFLNRTIHDFDFAVKKNGIHLAHKIAQKLNADFFPLDVERDTGRIIISQDDGSKMAVDFASFRGDDLEADLRGRDFTVNAMAIDPKSLSLYDPLGALPDLRQKILRACSNSTFKDDPVRIIRAVRFAAAFGFHIIPETRSAMKESAGLLSNVSPERQRDEFFRILSGPKPAAGIKALDLLGSLEPVLPELMNLKDVQQTKPHVQDVWLHSLSLVSHLESILGALAENYDPDTASNYNHGLLVLKIGRYRKQLAEHLSSFQGNDRSWREILIFSALYHDIAKPHKSVQGAEGRIRFWGHEQAGSEIAGGRAHRLALSNEEVVRIERIVTNHMRIHFHIQRLQKDKKYPSHRAIYRFFRDTGEAGVDICILTLADVWATYEHTLTPGIWTDSLDVVRIFLEAWWEKREELIKPPQLIDGIDLMRELSILPGPEVGRLLEAVREAQVTKVVGDRQMAIEYARLYLIRLQNADLKEEIFVNENKLAFFQRPGNSIPIILIHGYPLDHSIWAPIIPLLEKEYHLILPDLRGHGASQASDGPLTMDQMAEDIAGLMDFLKVKRAILVGHSLGGYVSLAFARKFPQKLLGLSLVSSKSGADSSVQRNNRMVSIVEIEEKGIQPIAEAMSKKLVADRSFSPQLYQLIMKMDPAGAVGAVKAMADRSDNSTILAELDVPILVLAGSADLLIPVEIHRQMAELSKNITYIELDGVGHMPMLESPAQTADALNNLVRACAGS